MDTTRRKYPVHLYPYAYRKVCVERWNKKNFEIPYIMFDHHEELYAASRMQVWRWCQLSDEKLRGESPNPSHFAPTLSGLQRQLVCGKVLHDRNGGKLISGEDLARFVRKRFGIEVARSTLSGILRSNFIGSKKVARKKQGFFKEGNVTTALDTIKRIRETIKLHDLRGKDVVCVDVFHLPGREYPLRTYAPFGRYVFLKNFSLVVKIVVVRTILVSNFDLVYSAQPIVPRVNQKFRDLFYSGCCGNGRLLPMVGFTKDENVPSDAVTESRAKVFVWEHKGKPTAAMTLAWWDTVEPWFDDRGLLILDKGSEFYNWKVRGVFKEYGINVEFLPASVSSFLDVCDNSFHSCVKSYWWKHKHNSHAEALKVAEDAYYSPSDESLLSMWERVGYLTDKAPTRYKVEKLISSGLRGFGKHEVLHDSLLHKFLAFRKNLRSSSVMLS